MELIMHFHHFDSLTRDDPEEARYYANPKKTAMTLFHVVRLYRYCFNKTYKINTLCYQIVRHL